MISSLSHISAHAKRMLQCHPIAVRACFGYKLGGNTPPPQFNLPIKQGDGERGEGLYAIHVLHVYPPLLVESTGQSCRVSSQFEPLNRPVTYIRLRENQQRSSRLCWNLNLDLSGLRTPSKE